MVQIKSPEQIAKMREAGLVVAAIHAATREAAVPGASTKDLDQVARKVLAEHNAKPNFLGYGGFPATICTSVNEVVVHGIPSDDVILKDGDIISIDAEAGTIDLEVDPEGLDKRRAKWQPRLNDSRTWIRDADVSYEMNEPDAYALEEALRLREKHGGEVVVCSAGPARVQQVIR